MDKLVIALFLATVAAGACAHVPTPEDSGAGKSNPTVGLVGDAGTPTTTLAGRNCVATTGTHIVRKGACVNVPGRSYDRTDIQQTGARTTGEALIRLDTALSVRGP